MADADPRQLLNRLAEYEPVTATKWMDKTEA